MTRTTPADLIDEATFQRQVTELAHQLGWTVNHVRRTIGGRRQGWVTGTTLKGWPDLVFLRPPRIVYAELKSAHGVIAPDQARVLELLRACGQEAHVWRPAQFDEIVECLNRRPGALR